MKKYLEFINRESVVINSGESESKANEIKKFWSFQEMVKNNFHQRLTEKSLNRERIELITDVAFVMTSENVKETYELARREEEGDNNIEVVYDENVMNIIDSMNWIPDSYIDRNFGAIWSKNRLVIGEKGDGVLIVGCLS